MNAFKAPIAYRDNPFTCVHCGVLSTHYWTELWQNTLFTSRCHNCQGYLIWYEKAVIWPLTGHAPVPNSDMPDAIKADYLEARSIAAISPRGAAALLRLAIDKLTSQLGAQGKTIDDRIQDLVNKGLDPLVQQMLDTVRVIGNEQVHPGQIDVRDDPEMLQTLFWLVNEIVDERITKPNRVAAIFKTLPENKRKGIADRSRRAGQSETS